MTEFMPADVQAVKLKLRAAASDKLQGVADSTVPPLDAVCRLARSNGSGGTLVCTGIAVRSNVLLTAAHNLIHTGVSRWVAFPGMNKGKELFPRVKALREIRHPKWNAQHDPEFDIGLLVLQEHVASKPVKPVTWAPSMLAAPVYVVGYGESFPKSQTFDTGRLTGTLGNFVLHDCETEPGHSGSPVFAWSAEETFLIAVHGYGKNAMSKTLPGEHGKAVRFTAELAQWISETLETIERSN